MAIDPQLYRTHSSHRIRRARARGLLGNLQALARSCDDADPLEAPLRRALEALQQIQRAQTENGV